MQIVSIVLLAMLGGRCFAEITIEGPRQRNFLSHLVDATVEIVSSCYGEGVNGIGVHGDPTGFLLRALSSKQILPVISIGNTTKLENVPARVESRYKLQLFTIVASSSTELQEILEIVKKSPWWNHMASFLIVSWTTDSDHECSSAFEFLWAAWRMNLLKVNLMCIPRTREVLLYTFNPYTRKAPGPWRLADTFGGKHDDPWSMFVHEYREDEDICEGLDFDKTRDLGGHNIASSTQDVEQLWHTNPNKTGRDSFEGIDGIMMQILFRTMNADVTLTTHSEDDVLIGLDDEGETTGVALDVIEGRTDIILNSFYLNGFMNLTTTYPHWYGGLGVVTQHTGYLSQLSKINSVIDVSSRYGLLSVILITVIFFKFFLRQSLMTAILNTLRITCNSGLPQAPKATPTRLYVAALFFVQITILALYQGQLASLLTKDVDNKKNVNTIQDLADVNHTIHGLRELVSYFEDPVFRPRFVGHHIDDCVTYVTRDSSNACVEDWDILTSKKMPPELHLSGHVIIEAASAYGIREDWPLELRVNKILATMTETDITRRTYTMHSQKMMSINKFNEDMRKNQGPKVLTLRQLNFAFVILAIGGGVAVTAFVVEIVVDCIYERWLLRSLF